MKGLINRHKRLTVLVVAVAALVVAGVGYAVWTSTFTAPPSNLALGSAPASVTAVAPLAFGSACVDSADPTLCEGHIRVSIATGTGHLIGWTGGGAVSNPSGMTGACTGAMITSGVSIVPSGTVSGSPAVSSTASDIDIPGLIQINNLNQACAGQNISFSTSGSLTFTVGP